MGASSDAFAMAREQKHVERPLRRQPKTSAPYAASPGKRLLELFMILQPDGKRRAKRLYKDLGKLSKPEIARRMAKLESEARYGTKVA